MDFGTNPASAPASGKRSYPPLCGGTEAIEAFYRLLAGPHAAGCAVNLFHHDFGVCDRYGGGLGVRGCPLAYAVSATASTPTLIDGVRDSDKALRAASTGGGREAVYSCGLLSWF